MGENEIVVNIRDENDKIEEDNEIDRGKGFKKSSWVWNRWQGRNSHLCRPYQLTG